MAKKQKKSIAGRIKSWPPVAKASALGAAFILVVAGGVYAASYYQDQQAIAWGASTCNKTGATGWKYYKTWDVRGPVKLVGYRRSGDRKCALLVSTGTTYGKYKDMQLEYGGEKDGGRFRYYAGPAYATGAVGTDLAETYVVWNHTVYVDDVKF